MGKKEGEKSKGTEWGGILGKKKKVFKKKLRCMVCYQEESE